MSVSSNSFILKNDDTIWACGDNRFGQLGLGDTSNRYTFTELTISNIKQIAFGNFHNVILKNDGTVWSCGRNTYGQLGLGDTTNRNTFTKIDVSDVKQISCGIMHNIILKNDGTLWACGNNSEGQLGLGDKLNRATFTQVDISDVKQISCGDSHTFILKNDGTAWACGRNSYGQLGLNYTTNISTFTQVDISDIKQISCGAYHTIILKNDGTAWSCGYNNFGQLGLGDNSDRSTFTNIDITNVKYISCGSNHTIILKNDGTLWACGYNSNGQLGLESATDRSTFVQLDISNVKDIYCGTNYTITLKEDSTVWACGNNSYGQLGLEDKTNITTFTEVNISDVKQLIGTDIIKEQIGPTYKLINIIDFSRTSSSNKHLITLPYRCKVFKYTLSTNTSIYYSMDNTLNIDSDISNWNLADTFTVSSIQTRMVTNPYICRQLLIEADNIDDLQIWAEYDDGSISIGKITNGKLSELSNDIRNNLYVTEDMYMYINDINGKYNRINGLYKELVFEGVISNDYTISNLDNYTMLNLVYKDNNDIYYNDSIYIKNELQNVKISHGDYSLIINISSNSISFSEINGLIITAIYGIQ